LSLVVTKKKEILEEMDDLVDRIDMAKNLDKIGGFTSIIKHLESQHPSLQWRAAQVFATVVQNNPYCQEAALKHNAISAIIHMFEQFYAVGIPSEDMHKVVFKALTASSCFIRHFQPAIEQFVQHNGVKLVLGTITSEQTTMRVKKKALYFLCYLLEQNQITRTTRTILEINAIPVIIGLMFNTKLADFIVRENAIKVMILLCKNGGMDEIKNAKHKIIPQVKARQSEISTLVKQDDIDQVEDEVNLLTEFLDTLKNFTYVPPASSPMATTTTTTTPHHHTTHSANPAFYFD